MTRLWIVRAGRHGERALEAITQGRLLPGFNELGDLSGLKDREATDEPRAKIPLKQIWSPVAGVDA